MSLLIVQLLGFLPKIIVAMATKYWVCMVKLMEENVPLTF